MSRLPRKKIKGMLLCKAYGYVKFSIVITLLYVDFSRDTEVIAILNFTFYCSFFSRYDRSKANRPFFFCHDVLPFGKTF